MLKLFIAGSIDPVFLWLFSSEALISLGSGFRFKSSAVFVSLRLPPGFYLNPASIQQYHSFKLYPNNLFYLSPLPGINSKFTQPAGNYCIYNMKGLCKRKKNQQPPGRKKAGYWIKQQQFQHYFHT